MHTTIRKALIAGGLGATALIGGAVGGSALNGVANAQTGDATTTTAPAKSDDARRGPHAPKEELTGENADKAKAAAQAAVADATVEHAHAARDGGYVVVMQKSDGTRVKVLVDETFKVTEVKADDRRGHRGPGGPGHGTPLTGDALEKAKAAALAAVPGATFDRAVAKPDGTIHAHVTKADGTHVHVAMDKDYKVTDVKDAPSPRRPRDSSPSD